MKRPVSDLFIAHFKPDCDICDLILASKYAFVQKYHALSHIDLPVDAMGKKLSYICLIWDRCGYYSDTMGNEKMYALTLLGIIRVLLNFVRLGVLTKLLNNNDPYRKKLIDLVGDPENREADLFYVDKFQRYGDATFGTNSATTSSLNAIQKLPKSVSIN